jgi:hypothetical protein
MNAQWLLMLSQRSAQFVQADELSIASKEEKWVAGSLALHLRNPLSHRFDLKCFNESIGTTLG